MTPNEQTAVEALIDFLCGEKDYTIIRCKKVIRDELRSLALLEASPTVPESRWIPVTEKLPEVGVNVLVWCVDMNGVRDFDPCHGIDFYTKDGYWDWASNCPCNVTHWQPLDEAPQ